MAKAAASKASLAKVIVLDTLVRLGNESALRQLQALDPNGLSASTRALVESAVRSGGAGAEDNRRADAERVKAATEERVNPTTVDPLHDRWNGVRKDLTAGQIATQAEATARVKAGEVIYAVGKSAAKLEGVDRELRAISVGARVYARNVRGVDAQASKKTVATLTALAKSGEDVSDLAPAERRAVELIAEVAESGPATKEAKLQELYEITSDVAEQGLSVQAQLKEASLSRSEMAISLA